MNEYVLSLVFGVLATLATSGCTFSDDLTERVERINKSVEAVQNESILENVIRASEDAPLTFTQLTVVRGSGTIGATGTLGLPAINFGRGIPLQDSFSATSSLSTSLNTNFDLSILESKEFWVGLQTPISTRTLAYFVRAGIPREILFYLYFNSIELISGDRKQVFVNDPASATFADFVRELHTAMHLGLTVETVFDIIKYGPPLPAAQVSDISGLAKLAKAGLVLYPNSTTAGTKTTYQAAKVETKGAICFERSLVSRNSAYLDYVVGPEATCDVLRPTDQSLSGLSTNDTDTHRFNLTRKGDAREVKVIFYPRSTLSIFHYLGALIKTGTVIPLVTEEGSIPGTDTPNHADTPNKRLFVVKVNKPGAGDFVKVTHRNVAYSISMDATPTIEILSLLRRLVALSTSVNDLQAGTTVTTVVR